MHEYTSKNKCIHIVRVQEEAPKEGQQLHMQWQEHLLIPTLGWQKSDP